METNQPTNSRRLQAREPAETMCQESFPFYFYTVPHPLAGPRSSWLGGSHKLLILIGTKITSIFAFSTFPSAARRVVSAGALFGLRRRRMPRFLRFRCLLSNDGRGGRNDEDDGVVRSKKNRKKNCTKRRWSEIRKTHTTERTGRGAERRRAALTQRFIYICHSLLLPLASTRRFTLCAILR